MRHAATNSIPRLSRRKPAGGVGRSARRTGGGFVRRGGSGGGGNFNPRVLNIGTVRKTLLGYNKLVGFEYYPLQRYSWPAFVLRSGCRTPLSDDCSQIDVTPHWAIACFKPTYHALRRVHGDDYQAIVDDLIYKEIPACNLGGPTTGAEYELQRRLQLAIAVLMNGEGVPIRYPQQAIFPRPNRAKQISQPWLRALLTGWV